MGLSFSVDWLSEKGKEKTSQNRLVFRSGGGCPKVPRGKTSAVVRKMFVSDNRVLENILLFLLKIVFEWLISRIIYLFIDKKV